MANPQLEIMMSALQKNQVFCFVTENITQIIGSEIQPFKNEIADGTVNIQPILESIRQKIVLYLNDLHVKQTIRNIPEFAVVYDVNKTVFLHFKVDEFCETFGVDGMFTQSGDMMH